MTNEEMEWSDYGRSYGPKVIVFWLCLSLLCLAFDSAVLWLALKLHY